MKYYGCLFMVENINNEINREICLDGYPNSLLANIYNDNRINLMFIRSDKDLIKNTPYLNNISNEYIIYISDDIDDVPNFYSEIFLSSFVIEHVLPEMVQDEKIRIRCELIDLILS